MLGEELKNIRLEKDLTLAEVARMTRLGIETVRRAENGWPTNERTAYKLEKFIRKYAPAPPASASEGDFVSTGGHDA